MSRMRFTRSRNSSGDTIIEVMFAMAIIGVILAAAYATASKNLQVSQLSKERSQASAIAESQLEQLKSLENAPSINSFCLNIEADPAVIASGDPACVEGFYTKTITKDGSQYKILVEWLPPGGSETNELANVTMFYSDYDFALSGSNNATIATVSSGASGVVLSASIRNQTSILSSGIVFSLGNNPRFGDGTSVTLLSSPVSDSFQKTVSTATYPAFDPNVIYYARSFATTPQGLVQSPAIRFSGTIVLTPPAAAPVINSLDETSHTTSTATISGLIDPSGSTVTRRELVYYRDGNPGSARTVYPTSNNFSETLTGLLPGVQYIYQLTVENSIDVTTSILQSFRTDSVTQPNTVPLGEFGNSSYYLSNDLLTWDQAHAAAQAMGGHLVTFSSAAENAYVSARFPQTSWIGATDRTTEGVWRWVNDEPFNYTSWATSEPNDYRHTPAGQDYGLTNFAGTGVWDDQGQADYGVPTLHRYVVEFDSIPPPTSKLGSAYAACTPAQGSPCAVGTAPPSSVYSCGNYDVRYAFSPVATAQYNAVVINYGDAVDYCLVGAATPPAALYNYRINVYINGVLNVSNFDLVPTIGRNTTYRVIPITPPIGPITSVNIEWTNNQFVSNASQVPGHVVPNPYAYDPDLQINNISLGYQ